MGIKFVIDGETIDVPRLSTLPQQGSIIEFTKNKETESKKYDVVLLHYVYDANNQFNRGDVLVHLKETEAIKFTDEELSAITQSPIRAPNSLAPEEEL